MKIAILGTRGLPARYGGFETLADRLGSGLAARDHHVVVYGRTGHNQPAQREISPRLIARRVPALPWRSTETISAGISAALHSLLILRPDVALVCNPANFWAARLLERAGTPVVLHLDGLEHQREKWQGLGSTIHRRAMQRSAASQLTLVTDSMAIQQWYHDHLGATPQVIAYGADIGERNDNLLNHLGLSHRGFDLIVARWEPENQLVEMINAHDRANINVPLIVVGEPTHGRYRIEVLQAIARHRSGRSVGQIWEADQLLSLYASARLYLHGHTVGGTNPTLLLGAASGAEVLAHNNPFNLEIIQQHGWLWRTSEELTALLADAPWTSDERATQLREHTITRYRWEQVIDSYEDLFATLVKRS